MRRLAVTRSLSLVLAAAALLGSFVGRGDWFIVPALAALAALWYLLRKYPLLWRSSAMLICYVMLAAASMLAGSTPILLIIGVAAALAAWDLMNFGEILSIAASPDHAWRLTRAHAWSLALALMLGLMAGALASLAPFELPFAVTALLAIVMVASLAEVLRRARVPRR